MILIQMDGNAKLGKEIISGDPHNISENGRLLANLIESENLFLLNSADICQGAITRNELQNTEKRKLY